MDIPSDFGPQLASDTIFDDFDLSQSRGCGGFWGMGLALLRRTDQAITHDSRLIKSGTWAGFIAGATVIIGNPKAMLFYIAILPGFFDLNALTALYIALIAMLSASIPFTGNLCVAMLVNRSRQFFTSSQSRQRIMKISSGLLIPVGR